MSYSDDFIKLTEPFPNGTVIKTTEYRAHIPVQVYQMRLEQVVGENWHWRIIDMPQLLFSEKMVIVKGELQLHHTIRQAIGFSNFRDNEPSKIKTAIASAEADAFRNCCDLFQMGWKDLAEYRQWASNPAINLKQHSTIQTVSKADSNKSNAETSRICLLCQKLLQKEDELFLALHNVQLSYCSEHVPKHFIKTIKK